MAESKMIICPTSRLEFDHFKQRLNELFRLLYQARIWRLVLCARCKSRCSLKKCKSKCDLEKFTLGYYQYCQKCHKRHALTKGSYLFGSKISFNQHMELLYSFYYDEPIKSTSEKLNIDRTTVIKCFKFFKQCLSKVIDDYYKNNKLGDRGIVEIDETLACKKYKHERGNRAKEKWVVAIFERNSKRCRFLDIGAHKRREDIIPFIKENVLRGKQIYTDQYSVYLVLGSEGYKHYTVNHKHRFACPYVVGANTDGVEGLFGLAKAKFKQMKGCHRNHLQIYLDDFTFRKLYKNSKIGLFNEILLAIGRMQDVVKLE